MKKIILQAFILFSFTGFSQPYGQTNYANGSDLNMGKRTNAHVSNSGFIMVGKTSGGTLHIEKTRDGGLITTSIGVPSFQRDYVAQESVGTCLFTTNFVSTFAGASITEITGSPSVKLYAMAGVYDQGSFLTILAPDGTPSSTTFYPFPTTASMLNRGPCILENPANGHFFMSGQYDQYAYAMELSATGAVLWSKYYDAGSLLLEPRAMLLSPHDGNLIIVGHCDVPIPGQSSDAFFLSLDPSTGNVNVFRDYNSTPCNWFDAITPSYSPVGGMGYVVGGYTDPSVGHICGALMMKLDLNGGIVWNTLIESATGMSSSDVMGVVERRNTTGAYEAYGVAQMFDAGGTNDLSVFKLDENGHPWSWSHPGMDEFHYSPPNVGFNLFPKSLSYLPIGTGFDEGLHVYASCSSGFYLLECYFNGITGCNNEQLLQIPYIEQGPIDVAMALATSSGPTACNDLTVYESVAPLVPASICSANTVPGGSNAKSASVAVGSSSSAGTALQVYPNPGSGLYMIESRVNTTILIANLLGEVVYRGELVAGKNRVDLLDQPAGVYMINIENAEETKSLRLIKN